MTSWLLLAAAAYLAIGAWHGGRHAVRNLTYREQRFGKGRGWKYLRDGSWRITKRYVLLWPYRMWWNWKFQQELKRRGLCPREEVE